MNTKKNNSNHIDLIMIIPGAQGSEDTIHIPLGILYVGSFLKSKGFDVSLHHILPQGIENTIKDIALHPPLFAGFSVLSGVPTYWSAVASELLKKKNPFIPIVWGGHHSSCNVESCLKESYIDVVVKGEGEHIAYELARVLQNNTQDGLGSIAGISYKDQQGNIINNSERSLNNNLDSLPLDFSLLEINQYIQRGAHKTAAFFSSRGCPYACTFCSTNEFSGRTYRSHSEEYTVHYLTQLKESYGIDSVIFSDDNFYLRKDRARNIIEKLYKLNIICNTLDVRLDQLDSDDMKFFKTYKVNGVSFGWESGSNRLLKLIKKNVTTDLIQSKIELIAHYDILSWGGGMMLLPTETYQEMLETIKFAFSLKRILRRSVINILRFMPLPKTELTNCAIQQGFIIPKDQKDWRRIDPFDTHYTPQWIPWYNTGIDYQLRYVQELSRTILSVLYPPTKLVWIFHNIWAYKINKDMANLSISGIDQLLRKWYIIAVRIYARITGKRLSMFVTKITDQRT